MRFLNRSFRWLSIKYIDVEYAIIGTGTAGLGAYSKTSRQIDSLVMIPNGLYGTTYAWAVCPASF